MTVGIIGFGRFGKLLAKYLSEDFEVFVFDKKYDKKKSQNYKFTPVSLKEVCQKDVIILSVPISQLERVLRKIKLLLKKGSLVVDVCSVKEYPAKLMKKVLPKNIEILATHPLFGPDSAVHSLNGQKIVLCKIRIDEQKYKKIKEYLNKKGLTVIETTPKEHDKQIALSLTLTHLIGRALIDFNPKRIEMNTECYNRLMHILGVVENDDWQLFKDMNNYNNYSKSVRKRFTKSLVHINDRLKQKKR